MTKREFLARLEAELRRGEVADAAEIMEEYAQHFAFKLADGYTQEEICARLGDLGELGRQFARPSEERPSGLKRALARTGVGLAGALGGLLATLLMVFGAVLALTGRGYSGGRGLPDRAAQPGWIAPVASPCRGGDLGCVPAGGGCASGGSLHLLRGVFAPADSLFRPSHPQRPRHGKRSCGVARRTLVAATVLAHQPSRSPPGAWVADGICRFANRGHGSMRTGGRRV